MATSQGRYRRTVSDRSKDNFITLPSNDVSVNTTEERGTSGRQQSTRGKKKTPSSSGKQTETKTTIKDYTTTSQMTIESPLYLQPQGVRRMSVSSETETMNPFSYTRTGRISKALKGKRVHACDVCDKQYTRAEHLRRHQLNHSTRLLQCDEKGCKRKFRREDLLMKHKEKHENDTCSDANGSIGRPSSSTSSERSMLAASGSYDQASFHHGGVYPVPQNLPYPGHYSEADEVMTKQLSLGGHLNYRDPGLHDTSLAAPVTSSTWTSPGLPSPRGLYTSTRPEYEFSNSIATSRPNQYLSTLPLPDLDPWATSVTNSNSIPASRASAWNTIDTNSRPRSQSEASSVSIIPILTSYEAPDYNIASQDLSDLVRQQWPPIVSIEERNIQEHNDILRDLATVQAVLLDSNRLPLLDYYRQQYLPLFWQNFHPTFAIVHRPTFEAMENHPPLLVAAMMAIGAQYLNDWTAKSIARRLHESCSRLLDKRPSPSWQTPEIFDMQTIVLVEAFNQFRSRRAPPRLSTRFESLYTLLLEDPEAYSTGYLELVAKLPYIIGDNELEAQRSQWLTKCSKRRVLLALYMLDVQQMNLLKSPTRNRGLSDIDYPFPSSDALWEARSLHEWHTLARKESPNAVYVSDALSDIPKSPIVGSPFRSALGAAYLACNPDLAQQAHVARLFTQPEQTRQTQLNFHVTMLAAHTPIRHLLAVSGESWVLGEKLVAQEQYAQADIDLTLWINSDDAKQAIYHAINVLRINTEDSTSGLLQEEWALYIAALVCWAHGLWHREDEVGEPPSRFEVIEEGMASFLRKMSLAHSWMDLAVIEPAEAQACLAWVKQRISGEMGALNQDASGVLKKLLRGKVMRANSIAKSL